MEYKLIKVLVGMVVFITMAFVSLTYYTLHTGRFVRGVDGKLCYSVLSIPRSVTKPIYFDTFFDCVRSYPQLSTTAGTL